LAVQSNGNIVVSGTVAGGGQSNLPLMNPILSASSGRFLIRLNPSGAVLQSTWVPAGGGPAIVDTLDNIYIGGTTSNLAVGQIVNSASVARMSATGADYTLLRALGTGVTIYGMAIDPSNNLYVTGGVAGSASIPEVRSMQTHNASSN